jgi:hypothetical protein
MHLFDHLQATNARTQHAADSVGQVIIQRRAGWQTSVSHRLAGSCNAEMNEGVHGARLFGAHVGLQVKAFDFTGNFAGEVGGIELGDQVNAGLTRQELAPSGIDRVAHRADAT